MREGGRKQGRVGGERKGGRKEGMGKGREELKE